MSFRALRDELNRWAADGARATLWWRDDDAVEATPALQRLLAVAASRDVPLALAVVPANVTQDAIDSISACAQASVLQHGIAHANHAPAGEKACEVGDHRGLDLLAGALANGRTRLEDAFRDKFVSVLVPPWNRIGPRVVDALPALGYRGLSTYGPRAHASPAAGLVQCNTHVDPIAWRVDRAFIGAERTIDALVSHLSARRAARVDPDEPTGLLTHHLDFDDAAWRFVADLLDATRGHTAARWLPAAAAFDLDAARATSGRSA